jgi:hypothetical protein
MILHRNAKLGLAGRLALVQAIEGGMSMKAAAAAFGVSPATAHRSLPSPALRTRRSGRCFIAPGSHGDAERCGSRPTATSGPVRATSCFGVASRTALRLRIPALPASRLQESLGGNVRPSASTLPDDRVSACASVSHRRLSPTGRRLSSAHAEERTETQTSFSSRQTPMMSCDELGASRPTKRLPSKNQTCWSRPSPARQLP